MQVLCLHDPHFFEALQGIRDFPLDLTDYQEEIAHLRAFDERLFRTDALRAERVLTGLIDCFPMTIWSLMNTDVFPKLRAYFSSADFYRVVLDNGYLHQSFAQFLQANCDVPEDWLEVELAFEDTKLQRTTKKLPFGTLRTSSCVKVVYCRPSRLNSFLERRRQIEIAGNAAAEFLLAQDRSKIPCFTEQSGETAVPFLVENHDECRITEISEGLAALLDFCSHERTQSDVETFLTEHGMESTECRELLSDFIDEGLLLGQLFTPDV